MRIIGAAILITIVAGCASSRLVDPGPQTWSGRLTCTGLSGAECNAAEHAILAEVVDGFEIDISPGAACPMGTSDCSYALLPGQRLLGHATIDPRGPQTRYANIRVDSNGNASAGTRVLMP